MIVGDGGDLAERERARLVVEMGRDEDGGDALGVKRLLEILVGGGSVGSDQAQLRSGHPDQAGVLVVRALDTLEEDLVGEAGRVGQTLRRGAIAARQARGRPERDPCGGAGRHPRRLRPEQLRQPAAGRLQELGHRGGHAGRLGHRRPDVRRDDRPAQLAVYAAAVDDGPRAEPVVDSRTGCARARSCPLHRSATVARIVRGLAV